MITVYNKNGIYIGGVLESLMKQFTIIKREDNGKDINRNGFVSVLFFITK